MSLYLKYRPQKIDELDLAGVRKTLSQIVSANAVSHAYLLTGPRGAGKTSTARILARIVNCEHNREKLGEPCNTCSACKALLSGSSLDFIEIDAASNRGIDDIRELKEKIRLAPSELKYKVYIIDEVHMLTTEAFNALLKTLEEPPAHALFILCTTETHKVPETIISRCSPIGFTKATPEEMKRSFKRVIEGEGKVVEENAIEYLAKSVDGSFRDGVKVLERVLGNSSQVTLAMMEEAIMGSAGYKVVPLVEALIAKDVEVALSAYASAIERGVDTSYLVVATMKELRNQLLAGADVGLTKLVFALDDVARKIATSPVPELLVEMVIIEWCGSSVAGNNQNLNSNNQGNVKSQIPNNNAESSQKEDINSKIEESSTSSTTTKEQEVEKVEKVVQAAAVAGDHKEVWRALLQNLEGDSITMGALLSKATPAHVQGDVLTIQVAYGFHRDQIMTEKVLSKLEKMVSTVAGRQLRIQCEVGVGQKTEARSEMRVESNNGTIDEAMAIFS